MASYTLHEGETAKVSATVTDEAGATQTSVDALTVTLYDEATGDVINSRDAQSLDGENNGTFTSGALVWEMQPADNAITDAAKDHEVHVALFEWTFGTTKKGKHEIRFLVHNLTKVTS
jgi:hypothetical protein